MSTEMVGVAAFGAIVGWFVYYINRYRKDDVQFSDLTTVIGIIGGAGITQLPGWNANLFGAYGIGLSIGFFGYFGTLIWLVSRSANFDSDWFLDGRRKDPVPPYSIPGTIVRPPMDAPSSAPPPSIVINAVAPAAAPIEQDVIPSDSASQIIDRCEAVWDANKADCNAFAKAVASGFQVTLNGQANDIVDQIQSEAGWSRLADGASAKAAADQGKLVIGGLKGGDMATPSAHGHVVVVVSGPLASGKYPTAYWGQLNAVGRKNTTVNYAWRAGDRDKVIYAARSV
jgi:hypothetical protein